MRCTSCPAFLTMPEHDQTKCYKCRIKELQAQVESLKPYKSELEMLVDRLGHDGGAVCQWGSKTVTAEEWALAVFHAAQDNEKSERVRGMRDVLKKIDELKIPGIKIDFNAMENPNV